MPYSGDMETEVQGLFKIQLLYLTGSLAPDTVLYPVLHTWDCQE